MIRTAKWLAAVAAVALLGYAGSPYILRTADSAPPLNTVVVSDRLATSGQPSTAQQRQMRAQGYAAVINLAPPDSYGAIADEAQIVAEQGLHYINIPVRWGRPAAADWERFRAALDSLGDRKVWVHCQMNMRASVFVLLRRVIDERVPVDRALPGVHAVWVPNAVWAEFIRSTLERHGVQIDPDLLR